MVGTTGFLILSSLGLFNWLVNFFAFHPEPGNFINPHSVDPTIQEIFFDASDGMRLQAFYLPRPNTDRVMLYLHGNAGNASMRLADALRLTHLGTNVFLLSYRGYGKSKGSPSEAGLYLDGQSALDYLQSNLGFSLERTIILGRSIGSTVAIELAQRNAVAGVVLVTPFSSGRDLARVMGLSWISWVTGQPFNSISKIQHVNAPMLFIHGTDDHIVPQGLARKLFDRCRSYKEWKSVQGADHNNLVQIAGEHYWEWIQKFLDSFAPQA